MGGVNWIKSGFRDGAKGEEVDGAETFRGVLALFPLDCGGGGGEVDDDAVIVDGFTPVMVADTGPGPGPGPPGPRLGGELF